MLAKRIIPCLDIRDGRTVKGVNFTDLRSVGDPVELGARYAAEGADELVYLDISATAEGRRTFTGLVSRIAARIDIPSPSAGASPRSTMPDGSLDAGADKITVNSAAVADPSLDRRRSGEVRLAVRHGGHRHPKNRRPLARHHPRRAPPHRPRALRMGRGGLPARRGRNPLHLDGPRRHAQWLSLRHLRAIVAPARPRHRLGAAGSVQHIADVLTLGRADAALAASIFHYGEIPIPVLKRELRARNIPVRL